MKRYNCMPFIFYLIALSNNSIFSIETGYTSYQPHLNITQPQSNAYRGILNTIKYKYNNPLQNNNAQPQTLYDSLKELPSQDLKNYFNSQNYSDQEILSLIPLYKSNEFIKLIKTLDDYVVTITALHTEYAHASITKKCFALTQGTYYRGFTKQLKSLKREIENAQKDVPTYALTQAVLSSHNFQKCAHQINNITSRTYLHKNIAPEIECLLDDSIDELYTSKSEQHFVFHAALIERILSDAYETNIPQTTTIHRCSHLFKQALYTFISHANPATQITQWGEFIIGTAHFIADITVGKLYLSKIDYQKRINDFSNTIASLSWSNLSQLTIDQWVDLGARLAADCLYAKGLTKVALYIKELNIIKNTQQNITKTITSLKNSLEAKLYKNSLVIKPDGTISRFSAEPPIVSGGMQKHIILNPRAHLENMQMALFADVTTELPYLQKKFNFTRKGFGESSNKYIKVDYEHILGIEPIFNKKGAIQKIGGFHLDYMNTLEKSGALEFSEKVMYDHGFYSAKLLYKGNIAKYKATFFPAHWTREQVIDAIFEAYDNFINNDASKIMFEQGLYHVEGICSTNTKIKLVITPTGRIITAYPLLV